MCFLLLSSDPPTKVSAKGSKGAAFGAMLGMQNNPNQFAVGLKDACCKEPVCCCVSTLGAPCGFTACWARSKVLDVFEGGIQDYKCCQGYIPGCCCMPSPETCCPGSPLGLCCEGCCFPVLSVSVARIHLMNRKQIRPDPCDWQIIACSNMLQLLACIFQILAIFVDALRDAADILDCLADTFTLSVAGCMGAQVYHETKTVTVAPSGAPPATSTLPVGAPCTNEEMER